MILKKIYDENTHTQKVWYDSSMIYYSEMVEDEFENEGDLYVTFKSGITYKYSKVKFEDYILFVGGGTDASQGKTLNKVIKGKYDFEKIGNADMNFLAEELAKFSEVESDTKDTYFVSGHRDITQEEFECNYGPALNYILRSNPKAKFVVGDYEGCDIMVQNYLIDIVGIDPSLVTVYHMFEKPRNINPSITKTIGGFQTDEERDCAMTKDSVDDIAFVRVGKWNSGTAQNILRRHQLKSL